MLSPCHRPRNAAATRADILDAATRRFVAESYDDVGLRDIGRDVGVDPALISRYFGSKEDLFVAVLDGCGSGDTLMRGARADFGRRVAQELIYEPKKESKLQGLLILLRSIGSARAMEVVQRTAIARFHGPFAEWVGGEDATIRARLASGLIMGMAISREITGGHGMGEAETRRLCDRLAVMLQTLIDE